MSSTSTLYLSFWRRTSSKGCKFPNDVAKSVQVTYGIWRDSKVTDKILLGAFGDLSESCESLDVVEGDRVKSLSIGYSNS